MSSDIPKLEQDPARSPAQLEEWAIQSQYGKTLEERQLAVSCLLAAAKSHARKVAELQQLAEKMKATVRELAVQSRNAFDRMLDLDLSKPAPIPAAVQAPGQNQFPVRGEADQAPGNVWKPDLTGFSDVKRPEQPATLVPCRLVKPEAP